MTISNKYQFGGNRELAIIRDGEKCVMCGMDRDEHKQRYNRDITVDHIDGSGRNTSTTLRNNSLNNLQTLCLPCHGKKDASRRANFGNSAKLITHHGKSKSFNDWSKEAKCSSSAFRARFYTYGWTMDKCLS